MIEREPERKSGLFVRGELQIDLAIDALREHALGSRALTMLVTLREVSDRLKSIHGAQDPNFSQSAFVDDEEMKRDLLTSLHQQLERTDLDDFDRAGIEELLYIQENQ